MIVVEPVDLEVQKRAHNVFGNQHHVQDLTSSAVDFQVRRVDGPGLQVQRW